MTHPHPAGPGSPAADTAEQWHRVHPVSPLVRGWLALLAVLFFIGRDSTNGLFAGGRGGPGALIENLRGRLPLTVLILAAALVVIAAVVFLSWYCTRYQITAEHIRVNSGVIFRQNRQARLDRVQAVDIVQPFLARVFSLAELRFDVADAGRSAVKLAYLPLPKAEQLRAVILARAAGLGPDPQHPGQVPEAPEQPILELGAGRVLGAALLSASSVFLVLALAGGLLLGVWARTPAALGIMVPALFGVVGSFWSTFSTSFNFRAALSPDGIRVRYGLLDTQAQTVPPGRVQAVGVFQSPLWRIPGWYRVKVNVAGYGPSGREAGRSVLLPVGTRDEVLRMLALVLPDAGTDNPVDVFTAGMAGRDGGGGFSTSPRRVRWLSPLTWRRNGFAVTRTALLVRTGRLWRTLAVVPHERVQSMALHQGPLARRLRVADLVLHSTPGAVAPRVIQADLATALALFDDQAARAAAARRRSLPERWMTHPADPARSGERQPGQFQPAPHHPTPHHPTEPDHEH